MQTVRDPQVIAHFADDPTRVYQLLQWVPVLERLDAVHPVIIVTRDPATRDVVVERTTLPVHCAPGFNDLTQLYDDLQAAVVLYCNNSMLNFNSLIDGRMLHVHINHGESDKHSMVSNNAKAYDRVFVAGEAAVQRHRAALMELDEWRLVRVGRPQLDLRPAPLLPASERRTVLYAPTWEGDADYNCYTSVDVFGPEIVREVLSVPDVRLVYKPHPKVTTSQVPAVREGHQAILDLVERAAEAEPDAGHAAIWQGDILAVFPGCDAMITDVSSVGLDWLYLMTDKPILITDRHHDAERLRQEVPVSRCADVVDADVLAHLGDLLAARLAHDEHRMARAAMRHHYFDDNGVGDSTVRFVEAVGELVELRNRLQGASPAAGFVESA
ncbi:putative glycosyl/glycerophosphate transferases involved in teichoic acid biosynthesis TagF/TagB/EpsJ/RodC [Nocardioides sp. J9]|uniref:CDP-glycerol glycerophosphotransferase family protein n=1 Tax=unclassified Nocardioides TaxID=2615069 RepID=UPI0004BAA9ED|nr:MULTISPECIES: CDP-glycerol glycerophosphotransferase family protein [unclassified Nocardioides]TWG93464.1 putative glycosyl/glycerophosphate transferases involved in teichoic acid biosynthesis TagF/TagB/EpsJ/RodC [Nocardioides sp. J9]